MGDGLFLRHVGGLPVGFSLGDFSPALDGAAYVYAFGGRIKSDGRQRFATYGCALVFVGDNQFDETLAKQKQNHPELTLAAYRLLPEIIAKREAIELGEQNIYFYASHGRLYRVVVKTTGKRHENYLTTL